MLSTAKGTEDFSTGEGRCKDRGDEGEAATFCAAGEGCVVSVDSDEIVPAVFTTVFDPLFVSELLLLGEWDWVRDVPECAIVGGRFAAAAAAAAAADVAVAMHGRGGILLAEEEGDKLAGEETGEVRGDCGGW